MNDQERLRRLILAGNACISIVTHEEEEARALLIESAVSMGRGALTWTAVDGVREGLLADGRATAETEHPAAAMAHLARRDGDSMIVMFDLADHLGDARTLRALRSLIDRVRATSGTLALVDHSDSLPAVIMAEAARFELSLPDEKELEGILRSTIRRVHQSGPVRVDITRGALDTIVRNLRGLTRRQARRLVYEMVAEDRSFNADDVNTALARKRQLLHQGGLLEYVEAPTSLEEVGGLARLKAWLKRREGAMRQEAADFGLSPARGVLLLGVQGAGKSLCAKAIATAWKRPLLRMDPGALYDRYVGESERRLRDALRQAEMMAPVVLWIDEIEKGFASAASHSTDGGLSKRMFGRLLTWMQEHESPVFLVATANDIEALPPEMLRKGRFDEIFFVDLPSEETRAWIFAIHLKRRGRDPDGYDLAALARAAEGFSGAEIEQAVVSALHEAFAAKKDLTDAMLLRAIAESPPLSVTMRERVEALRGWARGRCAMAD